MRSGTRIVVSTAWVSGLLGAWVGCTSSSPASSTAAANRPVPEVPEIRSDLGVGLPPPPGADVLLGGSGDSVALQTQLLDNWEHWVGPYRQSHDLGSTPVLWRVVPDPEFPGSARHHAVMTCCQSPDDARGVVWGIDDLITKKTYGDIRLHVEFTLMGAFDKAAAPASRLEYGNSGVYLQNRYEIQIKTPEKPVTGDAHEMGSLVDQVASRVDANRPNGQWQAYDVVFRASRWREGRQFEPANITVYWNGRLAHANVAATAPATGGSSGVPVDSTRQGLKLQSEGTDVRFRNVWVRELDIPAARTDTLF